RQFNVPDRDVFSGLPFEADANAQYTLSMVDKYFMSALPDVTDTQASLMTQALVNYYVLKGKNQSDAEKAVIDQFKNYLGVAESASYESNMRKLGYVEKDNPKTISIYAVDFESKDEIIAWIDSYNAAAKAEGKDENIISYTDYIGIMMSSISIIINAISYVLIGFVSISLIVSSIMIGVITYISVLERTKEIGILRSIGASKRDISRVFNAETLIVGFVAGVFGVGIAFLIDIPINLILQSLAGLYGIAAIPWWGAIGLIVISVVLTLIAGIIPSGFAAKKDPVIALRTE
ncbi:MAG: ABC transporter permease, partial [Clostridia bacterium]|nr:ABC transporter permease [Clostridia bacterium]